MLEYKSMNKKPAYSRNGTEQEWTWTFLGLALVFGVFVRILPGYLTGFPINDGGMFAVMMRDLRQNQYVLPVVTTYNLAEIPFAYPPLGIYLGAWMEALGVSEANTLLWLPAFFTALTIPALYWLSVELMGNRPRASLTAVFFALAPGNYIWLLMGGGLTRSLGTLFLIVALASFHRALRAASWRFTGMAILFCALTVISHPQSALLLALGCAVFLFFSDISRFGIMHAAAVFLGTALLTAPWWGTVVARHGFVVFLSAGQSGDLRISFSALLRNLFSRQTILPFVTLFWLLGLGWAIYKRRFDLLVWGFVPYLLDQRSASIATSLLYPMLAAYGVWDVLPALFHVLRARQWRTVTDAQLINTQAFSMAMFGVVFYLFIECVFHTQIIRTISLSPSAVEMMVWVRDHTPAESDLLLLTGREDVMTDPVQEWFPAVAARHSVTTLQGLEWILHDDFNLRWAHLAALQSCGDAECLAAWSQAMSLAYDYIVVDSANTPPGFFQQGEYQVLFENERYMVLK